MKKTTSTVTTEGVISHQLHLPTGILCPVQVTLNPKGPKHLPGPVSAHGRYVHALPGGGSFVP